MLKRNFYIFLSSVVAIVAVLGWMEPYAGSGGFGSLGNGRSAEGQVAGEIESEGGTVKNLYYAADSSILSTLLELTKGSILQAYLSEDAPTLTHIRLFGPDTPPKLDHSTIVVDKLAQGRAALADLKASEHLAKAKLVAIVDIDGGEVLVSNDAALAQRILMKLRTKERESEDTLYQLNDGELLQVAWHCVGINKSRCLLSASDARIAVEGELSCRLTSAQYAMDCDALTGDATIIDTTAAFLTTGCPVLKSDPAPEKRSAALRDIANSAEDSGQVKIGPKAFNYKKQAVNNGCTLIALNAAGEEAAGAALPPTSPSTSTPADDTQPEVKGLYSPYTIIIAVLIGLVMGVLGLLLLRAPKADQSKQESPDQDVQKKTLDRLANESNRIGAERDRLKVRMSELEDQMSGMEGKNTSLHNTIDMLEIRCQELETDKQQLLEAFSPNAGRTVTDSFKQPSSNEDNSAVPKMSLIALEDSPKKQNQLDYVSSRQTEELAMVNIDDILLKEEEHHSDLPTSELSSADIAAVRSSEHPSIHDYFPDDGWDEIAASFDAIISESKSSAKNSSPQAKAELLENESNPEESVFGMTSFLESVRESDQRVTQDPSHQSKNTETPIGLHSLKSPQKFSSIPQIGLASSTSKGLPKLPSMSPNPRPSSSKPGDSSLPPPMPASAAAKQASSERQITEAAADMATKKPTPNESGGFKPAPSWTGQRAQDNVGMDQGSLLDALKRRTRDVSEIQNAVTDPSKPQAFEFNRALSKSGVFSMTGSRVDINPNSDTETFKSLYDRFVESQRETGESSDRFTLEQFVNRLAREKEQLMKSYSCKDVRFLVYVKDGKTSLKATPVK